MKQITQSEFETEVLAAKQPVLVDFYTDTCPPCRAMAPVLQEWETEANGTVKVVKVNAAEEPGLATAFRVSAVPTFLLFSNGQCVGQTIGAKSKNNMKKWFDDSLKAETDTRRGALRVAPEAGALP